MKIAAMAAVFAVCAAVCESQPAESPEAVIKSTTAAIKELTAALAKVKDEASAKKEASNVNTMGDSLAQEYIAYGEVAEGAEAKAETKDEMDAAETKLDTEIQRVTGDGKIAAVWGDLTERIKTFRK